MKYFLSKYSRASDDLIDELDVSHVGLERLAAIFEQDPGTFVDSYPVGRKEAEALAEFCEIEIDLEAGEYFIEVFEDESE
jgi:hypothetical protein